MSISIAYQENTPNQGLFALRENLQKFLLYLRNEWFVKYTVVNAAQQTFAEDMGVTRETINRWLKELEAAGAITITRNPVNNYETCRYEPTPLLKKSWYLLRHFYVMLKYAALPISNLLSPAEPVVTQYKSFTEKETNECSLVGYVFNSPSLSYYREPRATQTGTIKKLQLGGVMEHEWLSPELKGITDLLNLNKWGQIKLSAFPKQALQHAAVVYRSSKAVKKDQFHWFREVCNEWCRNNNVSPDYGLLYRLEAKYNMPENPAYVLEKKPSMIEIPEKKPAPAKKLFPDWQGKKFFTEEEHEKHRYDAAMKFAEKNEDNIFRIILLEGWAKQP